MNKLLVVRVSTEPAVDLSNVTRLTLVIKASMSPAGRRNMNPINLLL